MKTKKVAIIGAGMSGLCVAKHLLAISDENSTLQPMIFEQNNHVGGTWAYQEKLDEEGYVHSSMFKNLRTDLPKQVMNFPDFPFPEDSPTYLHHTEVRKYLEDYAKHFDLFQHIRFQTKVVSVDPLPVSGEGDWCRWLIEYQQLDCHLEKEEFDAVVVCNGHYSKPCYPDIPGLEHYKNKKLHSHFYRDPEDYKGTKKALILGFGPSGSCIGLELAEVCDKVYVCHKGDRCHSTLPENLIELTNITHVQSDGSFVTEAGDVINDVELFLICTGYDVEFPFLKSNSGLEIINGKTVKNLYKHMFNIEHPSLCIVGLPFKTIVAKVVHQQSVYLSRVLAGLQKLPCRQSMLSDTEQEVESMKSQGISLDKFHFFMFRTPSYCNSLSDISGCDLIKEVVWKLAAFSTKTEKKHLTTFRQMQFRVSNESEFELLNPEILESN